MMLAWKTSPYVSSSIDCVQQEHDRSPSTYTTSLHRSNPVTKQNRTRSRSPQPNQTRTDAATQPKSSVPQGSKQNASKTSQPATPRTTSSESSKPSGKHKQPTRSPSATPRGSSSKHSREVGTHRNTDPGPVPPDRPVALTRMRRGSCHRRMTVRLTPTASAVLRAVSHRWQLSESGTISRILDEYQVSP